jgi:hypothetical protein
MTATSTVHQFIKSTQLFEVAQSLLGIIIAKNSFTVTFSRSFQYLVAIINDEIF